MRRNLLFGRKISIVKQYLTSGIEHAELIDNKIIVYLYPSGIEAEKKDFILKYFFKAQLKDYLSERMKYFCGLYNEADVDFDISYKQSDYTFANYDGLIRIRKKKILWFNHKIVQCPKDAIDTIIVCILCNFKAGNDKDAFERMVSEQMPDYKERCNKLKQYTPL